MKRREMSFPNWSEWSYGGRRAIKEKALSWHVSANEDTTLRQMMSHWNYLNSNINRIWWLNRMILAGHDRFSGKSPIDQVSPTTIILKPSIWIQKLSLNQSVLQVAIKFFTILSMSHQYERNLSNSLAQEQTQVELITLSDDEKSSSRCSRDYRKRRALGYVPGKQFVTQRQNEGLPDIRVKPVWA